MRFEKGQSGNPNGRPRKTRALANILEVRGQQKYEYCGELLSGNEILSRIVWDILLKRKALFMDRKRYEAIKLELWENILKFYVNHTEGPPRAELDITTGDEPLSGGIVIILPSNGREIETPTGTADDVSE